MWEILSEKCNTCSNYDKNIYANSYIDEPITHFWDSHGIVFKHDIC